MVGWWGAVRVARDLNQKENHQITPVYATGTRPFSSFWKKIYHIILTFFYTLKSCSCYQFVLTIEDKTKLSLRYTRVNPPSWTYKLKSYQHVLYTILETCTVSTLIYFENEEIFSSLAWVSRIIEIIIQTMRNLIVASVECKI